MTADCKHTHTKKPQNQRNQLTNQKKGQRTPLPQKQTPRPEYLEYLNLRKTESKVNKLQIKSIKQAAISQGTSGRDNYTDRTRKLKVEVLQMLQINISFQLYSCWNEK